MDFYYQVLLIGVQGYSLSEREKSLFKEYSPGGVVLFNRNVESHGQLAALCQSIYEHCEIPPLITIDQEGGLVSRLRPIIQTMETEKFAGKAHPDQIQKYGRLTGELLALLGIGLNFAPVVDIKYSDADNALRTRYWGDNKELVASRASDFLSGMNSVGMLGCLKHFPGLGNTDLDSHVTLPVNKNSYDELVQNELYPYSALKDQADMVMTAHCHYPSFETEQEIPASASPKNYDLLRNYVGFRGVTITDDLGMGGISNSIDVRGRIRDTINAGANLLPFCNSVSDMNNCFPMLKSLVESGELEKSCLTSSLEKISLLKKKIPDTYLVPDNLDERFAKLSNQIGLLNQEVLGNE